MGSLTWAGDPWDPSYGQDANWNGCLNAVLLAIGMHWWLNPISYNQLTLLCFMKTFLLWMLSSCPLGGWIPTLICNSMRSVSFWWTLYRDMLLQEVRATDTWIYWKYCVICNFITLFEGPCMHSYTVGVNRITMKYVTYITLTTALHCLAFKHNILSDLKESRDMT